MKDVILKKLILLTCFSFFLQQFYESLYLPCHKLKEQTVRAHSTTINASLLLSAVTKRRVLLQLEWTMKKVQA